VTALPATPAALLPMLLRWQTVRGSQRPFTEYSLSPSEFSRKHIIFFSKRELHNFDTQRIIFFTTWNVTHRPLPFRLDPDSRSHMRFARLSLQRRAEQSFRFFAAVPFLELGAVVSLTPVRKLIQFSCVVSPNLVDTSSAGL